MCMSHVTVLVSIKWPIKSMKFGLLALATEPHFGNCWTAADVLRLHSQQAHTLQQFSF